MKTVDSQLPPKVTADKLRIHFRTTYKLSDEQVEVMLTSSVKSLTSCFSALHVALDREGGFEEVFRSAHSLKGLLLNMGENLWAGLARELELAAAGEEERDYHRMVSEIRYGIEDILKAL